MSLVFPLPFDGDAPAIVILDADGNNLDDSLDENTYATFGTIPKGGSSTLTLYAKNTGATPIYSVKCEGIASSNQLGEAANTYEAVDLPQELGNIDPRETIELQVVWTVPTESPTGMKIFGLKVTDSTYLTITENHEKFSKITITNNDTDLLLDFPVEINFSALSITWASTTNDGRDLRFYDDNFNELPYYIDTWTPATLTGKVYVRVPKIEGGESIDIYMGYGKFDLYSISDASAKYEVYENFNGAFDENWTAVLSLYDFTTVVDCVYVTSIGNTNSAVPTLVLALPRPLKGEYVVEFAAKYAISDIGPDGRTGAILCLADSLTQFTCVASTNCSIPLRLCGIYVDAVPTFYKKVGYNYDGLSNAIREFKIVVAKDTYYTYYPPTTLVETTANKRAAARYVMIGAYNSGGIRKMIAVDYLRIYRYASVAPTITFADVADITAEFTNPDVDSGIICVIGNVVRQLAFHDYDFKKIIYEVGYNNALWRPPGGSGIYVWGKLEMRPLYGEDVSFVDNLYANDAYFYTFTDYTYDIHDKLDVEGVLYDIQAIQVHDAGSETIYKTLILKRQPEYYACCVGVVS